MFSELKNIRDETGLVFSDERTALSGTMRGIGVIVSDAGDIYEAKFFCRRPFDREADIAPVISSLGESLPKNTIMSQSCEADHVCVRLAKYNLIQEDIVHLTVFLDKLTAALGELGLEGLAPSFPRVKRSETVRPAANEIKIRLGFDLRSVFGLFGAILGAAAMTVIAILLVDAKAEADTFGLRFEISTYILSAATAAVTFADYRFLARKLDACGIVACPILSLASVVFAGLGSSVKALALLTGDSFMQVWRELPQYVTFYPEIEGFMAGYITRGLVLAVLASIGACVFYFSRHPDETVLSEKIVQTEDEKKS